MRRFWISAANRGPKRFHPHRLVADVDATFEQNVFNLAQRKRIAEVQHHREANDLRRAVEITEGISHRLRLRNASSRLKPIYSDNAVFHSETLDSILPTLNAVSSDNAHLWLLSPRLRTTPESLHQRQHAAIPSAHLRATDFPSPYNRDNKRRNTITIHADTNDHEGDHRHVVSSIYFDQEVR